MFIKVISVSYQSISKELTDADFYLEIDFWNDWDYYTTYHLHLSSKHTIDKQPVYIGAVKILRKGQRKKEGPLLELGEMKELDSNFCSLGQSLDYYERIAQLDGDLSVRILKALRDIVVYPENKIGFEDEDGYNTSLLRGISSSDDIFTIGQALISKNFQTVANLGLAFSFKIEGMIEPMQFDFNTITYDTNKQLPSRVAVIIGRNGSGKSTVLSRISRVAFASSDDRGSEIFRKIGSIEPNGIGFPRIINISYSSFDTFQVPGINKKEKEQIAAEINRGIGRYIFCGVRDVVEELGVLLPQMKFLSNGRLTDEDILNDRQEIAILKQSAVLTEEFVIAVTNIQNSSERISLFGQCIEILREETSLHYLSDQHILKAARQELSDFFEMLSTGHKFVLHSISSIILHIQPRSLILFDEPEIHLHPPLLAVLMKVLRVILSAQNSYMITATHSPVVLQETLSKHIHIIRREGDQVRVLMPEIQTYGENIGMITSHIFGLTSDITVFYQELDEVVNTMLGKHSRQNIDAIISDIEQVFDGQLSMQARAYILSKLYKNK